MATPQDFAGTVIQVNATIGTVIAGFLILVSANRRQSLREIERAVDQIRATTGRHTSEQETLKKLYEETATTYTRAMLLGRLSREEAEIREDEQRREIFNRNDELGREIKALGAKIREAGEALDRERLEVQEEARVVGWGFILVSVFLFAGVALPLFRFVDGPMSDDEIKAGAGLSAAGVLSFSFWLLRFLAVVSAPDRSRSRRIFMIVLDVFIVGTMAIGALAALFPGAIR